MQRALSVAPFLVVFLVGCGDDGKRAISGDTVAPDVVPDTTVDAPPDAEPPPVCEAAVTEVDQGFVEVVAHGPCNDWSIAIRDGAVAGCTLAAEVFFPHDQERMALQGFQVPATAVIVLQDPKLRSVAVWTV